MTNPDGNVSADGEWIGPEMQEATAEFLEDQPIEDYRPAVSPKTRDIAYFAGLGISALEFAAAGVALIWLEDPLAGQVAATAALAGGATGIITGGLGVKYRPGKYA